MGTESIQRFFFLGRKFEIWGIYTKSLTSLVFYTNEVLKIVILYVRLNSVLRRYVISEARLKKK